MYDYILESADVTNVSIDDIELTQLFAEMAVLEAMMDCYEKQLVLLEYNEESAEEIFIEETYGLTKYNGARESKQDKDTDNVKEMPSTQDDSDIEKRAAKNKDKRSKLIFKIKRGIHKFLQMIVLCVRKMIDEFKTLTIGLPLLKAAFDYDSYAVKNEKRPPDYDINEFKISEETRTCMTHLSEIVEEMDWCSKAVESLVEYRMTTTDESYIKNKNKPDSEFTAEKYKNNRGDYYKNPKDYCQAIDKVIDRCDNVFKKFKYDETTKIDIQYLLAIFDKILNVEVRDKLRDIQKNVSKAYNEYDPDQTIPTEVITKLRTMVKKFMDVNNKVFKHIREFTVAVAALLKIDKEPVKS